MGILRHLQHWFIGRGPHLQTAEFVPETHPMRLWADTFPWDSMVHAVEQSVTRRFPTKRPTGGRPPVSPRVLLALELLQHEWGESDDDVCHRLRTDVAVMDACGLREVQADHAQAHVVLPETLVQFRRRIEQDVLDDLGAIQAAAAMHEGLVSPAHLLVDTVPSEHGSQRVTDATTLDKAQKKSCTSSSGSVRSARSQPPDCRPQRRRCTRPCKKSCGALVGSAGAKATSSSSWSVRPHSTCWTWTVTWRPGPRTPTRACVRTAP